MPYYIEMKDIMGMYKVSRSTVNKWIEEGMPAHKHGRLWRFVEAEVDTWYRRAQNEHHNKV